MFLNISNSKQLFSILIYIRMYFISVMQSWIFSIIIPVFSVTWSFRNHSNMLICCSRHNSSYQYWKQLCCKILLWKPWYIFSLMNRKLKRTQFIWISKCYKLFLINLMHSFCIINLFDSACFKLKLFFEFNLYLTQNIIEGLFTKKNVRNMRKTHNSDKLVILIFFLAIKALFTLVCFRFKTAF